MRGDDGRPDVAAAQARAVDPPIATTRTSRHAVGRRARRTASSSRPTRAGCCGTPAARATGRSGGARPGLQDFFPYDKVSDEEYLDSRLNSWASASTRSTTWCSRTCTSTTPATSGMFKDTNARLVCSDKEKEFAFGFDGAVHRGPPQDRLRGPELRDGLGRHRVPARRHADPDPRAHRPASMSMQVDLPDTGTMIFTSDAVYMGESYGPPATPAAIVNDMGQFYSSVEKLRGIQEKTNATDGVRPRRRADPPAADGTGGLLHMSGPDRRTATHRGDDLHLGGAAAEVRRRRRRRDRLRDGRLRRAAGPDRHRPGRCSALGLPAADRRQPAPLRHRVGDLRRRARRADRRLDEQGHRVRPRAGAVGRVRRRRRRVGDRHREGDQPADHATPAS